MSWKRWFIFWLLWALIVAGTLFAPPRVDAHGTHHSFVGERMGATCHINFTQIVTVYTENDRFHLTDQLRIKRFDQVVYVPEGFYPKIGHHEGSWHLLKQWYPWDLDLDSLPCEGF